jgi:hypothetical protein
MWPAFVIIGSKCELVTRLISPFKIKIRYICNLVEFSMSKVTQNPISLTPIGVKITKSPLRNLTHQGLSKKYQECNQVFLSFDFVKFPLRKLYTIQSLPHCSFKQYI